jgi:hypothetical protein
MNGNRVHPSKNQRISFAVLVSGFILVLCGIGLGEPGKVLEQATQICLSCIGIG